MPKKVSSSRSGASPAAQPNAPARVRRSPFNREYQRRAAQLALSRVACELIQDPNSGFYRPGIRPNPVPQKNAFQLVKEARQLALNFDVRDPAKPLADVFPEFYDEAK